MTRFFLAMTFYVLVGRWLYSETVLVFPTAAPYIKAALRLADIPTHDKWNVDKVSQHSEIVSGLADQSYFDFNGIKESLKESVSSLELPGSGNSESLSFSKRKQDAAFHPRNSEYFTNAAPRNDSWNTDYQRF